MKKYFLDLFAENFDELLLTYAVFYLGHCEVGLDTVGLVYYSMACVLYYRTIVRKKFKQPIFKSGVQKRTVMVTFFRT